MSINYIGLQEDVIRKYKINLDPNSKCWKRMHVHIKERKICKWEYKNSWLALFELLHEIGHIEANNTAMRRFEQELTATEWAIDRIKGLDLPLNEKVILRYENYIKRTLDRGLRRGLTIGYIPTFRNKPLT